MATAPTRFGVPPSSRAGASAQTMRSSETSRTVPPPAWVGSPRSNAAFGPTRIPAPNGAYILCALKAR